MRKESWGRWGGGGGEEAKGSQPASPLCLLLFRGCWFMFTTSTFSTNKSKTFFLQHRFGVKKTKALLKVAYLKCFFLWNLPVEKFGGPWSGKSNFLNGQLNGHNDLYLACSIT